jgi:hypothetical protein
LYDDCAVADPSVVEPEPEPQEPKLFALAEPEPDLDPDPTYNVIKESQKIKNERPILWEIRCSLN